MEIKGIKYISCFFDGSGYAAAARGNVLALHKQGIPLTLSPVSFEKARPELGKDGEILKGLVDRDIDYNIVLTHLTPEHWKNFQEPGKTHISYTIWETSKLHPDWPGWINQYADKVLVGCHWNKEVFQTSGVTIPIGVVPHGINMQDFDGIKPYNVAGVDKDTYMFYSIFQFTERKNPLALIKAYWHEFKEEDNVALVLKTYRGDYSDGEKSAIRNTIKKLKSVFPNDYHPPVYLIPNLLTNAEILGLHARGDCYASFDRGEGFGLCVAGSTNILIPDGVKPAKEIENHDYVLSSDGKFHKITDVSTRHISTALKISSKLHEDIIVSREHPFLIDKNITRHKRYNYSKMELEKFLFWAEASEVSEGDYVALPKLNLDLEFRTIDISQFVSLDNIIVDDNYLSLKNGFSPKNTAQSYSNLVNEYGYTKKIFETAVSHLRNNTLPKKGSKVQEAFGILVHIGYELKKPNNVNRYVNINDDLLTLFGWYLAEGSTDNDNSLEIDLHIDEYPIALSLAKIFKKEFGVKEGSILTEKFDNKSRIVVSSRIIANFFSTIFGKGAYNKHIPGWLFTSARKLKPLIKALFKGDGHDTGRVYGLTTVSPSLAYQTKTILTNLGACPRIIKKKKGSLGNYDPYIVSIANDDYIDFTGNDISDIRKHSIETENFFLVKIKSIEEIEYNDIMYDFSVEDAKSFVGNGLLLHNSPFTAGACSNPIIVTNYGGSKEYAKDHTSYRIDRSLTPVFGMPFSPWYRGDQLWAEVDVKHGADLMRRVYENQDEAIARGKIMKQYITDNLTWRHIGKRIIEEIERI